MRLAYNRETFLLAFALTVTLACSGRDDRVRTPVEDKDPDLPVEVASEAAFEPRAVRVSIQSDGVLVAWEGTGQNIPRFHVYRREANSDEWNRLDEVSVGKASRGMFTFLDVTATPGTTYIYGVSTENYYRRESRRVESEAINVP